MSGNFNERVLIKALERYFVNTQYTADTSTCVPSLASTLLPSCASLTPSPTHATDSCGTIQQNGYFLRISNNGSSVFELCQSFVVRLNNSFVVCLTDLCSSCFQEQYGGFPGGAVVGNLPANAGDTGSSPGLGRSHMPRSD